jgi:hypothetical protein
VSPTSTNTTSPAQAATTDVIATISDPRLESGMARAFPTEWPWKRDALCEPSTVTEEWERFARPGFALRFSYPRLTPDGHAVAETEETVRDHRGDMERVHFTSPGSSELYVEVARFREHTPQQEYDNHGAHLKQRFGADAVAPLTETTLGDRAAWTYAFRWDEGERSVLLVQIGADTYRVLYDPRSALNEQVVDSITFVG